MILVIIMLILLFFTIWVWYHPESILIPLNLLYNTDSSPRTTFYTDAERNIIFPVGKQLEAIWEDIRNEGYFIYDSLPDKNLNYLDNYHINIGHEDKKQWTTIPLRLFGQDSPLYMNQCLVTSKILRDHPEIKSCLFSVMAPGKIIHPHVGPYDGLLRYQLALDIPTPTDVTQECYLHVNNIKYNWTEGEGVLFDEANLHGAVNTTDKKRMVLLIDLERPYASTVYRSLNKFIISLMGLLPATKQITLL
jgi:aspartyl/asparaginyl beta-hydroxylase (cupin superfamily)